MMRMLNSTLACTPASSHELGLCAVHTMVDCSPRGHRVAAGGGGGAVAVAR